MLMHCSPVFYPVSTRFRAKAWVALGMVALAAARAGCHYSRAPSSEDRWQQQIRRCLSACRFELKIKRVPETGDLLPTEPCMNNRRNHTCWPSLFDFERQEKGAFQMKWYLRSTEAPQATAKSQQVHLMAFIPTAQHRSLIVNFSRRLHKVNVWAYLLPENGPIILSGLFPKTDAWPKSTFSRALAFHA